VNAPKPTSGEMKSARWPVPAPDTPGFGAARLSGTLQNLGQWGRVLLARPRMRVPPPSRGAIVTIVLTLVGVVALMFVLDIAASAWARGLPRWVTSTFEVITDFGLSGWFLIPSGAIVLLLAAATSPSLTRVTQGVLAALAVRFGFLFLAIGVPGLFVTIVKRLIGRARPYVDNPDDPFTYMPFAWRPEYASMPSGHATTAAAAAIAIGAIWPKTRAVMWLYALIIMASRVIVLAHHPSDVLAGALVGATGAVLVRRWFCARRLGFAVVEGRVAALPGPSLKRMTQAVRWALASCGRS